MFSGCFLCDRCHDSECFHKTMSCDSSEDPNRRRCRTTECESLKKHNKQIIRRGSASHADESNLTNAELTCETLRLLWVEIKGLSPSVFVQELPVLQSIMQECFSGSNMRSYENQLRETRKLTQRERFSENPPRSCTRLGLVSLIILKRVFFMLFDG